MDQLETLPLDAGGEANVLLKQEEFAEAAPAEEALPVGEPGDEYNDADYDEALDPDYAEEGAEEGAEEEEHEQMEDPIDDIEEEAPNLEDLELKDAVKTKEKEKQGSKLQEKDALDEALQVEASSVQDDAALPERNTRKEQLTKKLKDRAAKEAKKKQQDEEKKRKEVEKKRKQDEKAAEKPKKRLKKAEETEEVPSAPLTRKRSKTKMVGAEEPAAVKEVEVPEPALPQPVGPKKKAKKRKSRASGKPKGRPRKKDVATQDPAPEAVAPKPKKPRRPKCVQFTYDKVLCQKLEDFMKEWGHEEYSKKNHDLHKVKGFNVYDKGRCGAGFKLGGARSKQIGYFGIKVSCCDSLAVNVWLAKVFYDKVHAEGLDEEWAESEAGIEYKTLLTNTAKVADANLTPDDVD